MTPYFISPEVPSDAISPEAVIHPGCRLYGKDLSIGPGCVLGEEGPVTVRDCQLGRNVHLAGGFYDQATLLDGVVGGDQAHVRPACLFEEDVTFGHCCGFKQTLLMPFVTAGSLANFCDVLMAGGTSRKNHSEVGSSYVHFNFTPYRDKATASLIGDVPQGVLLDQPPIFLGGQGGVVGPRSVAFGSLIPAGQVCRRDITRPCHLVVGKPSCEAELPYPPPYRVNVLKVFNANLLYIGNLLAFDHWYRHIRQPFMMADVWHARCHRGALQRFAESFEERVKRLDQFVGFLAEEKAEGQPAESAEVIRNWPRVREKIENRVASRMALPQPPLFVSPSNGGFIAAVQALGSEDKAVLQKHLQGIVELVRK